jgi:alpha-glucosidase
MNIRPFPRRSTGLSAATLNPTSDSLFSDGSIDFVFPSGPHRLGQKIQIRLRGLQGVDVKDVHLRTFPDGEERLVPMSVHESPPFTYWAAEVTLACAPFPYRFRLQTSRQVLWFNGTGLHQGMPPDEEDFRLIPGFTAPRWAQRSVFYQIFPDRFYCGKPETALAKRSLSPSYSRILLKKWTDPLSHPNEGVDFYGGDLWGILQKLDYLEHLGVNALYLTPIFTALSNHRYDTVDYRNVDPYLGGNDALIALTREMEKRGMSLVLDGVFNHAGLHHPWFKDAQRDKNSPCSDMFSFTRHPTEYVCWLGHRNLPKLNFASPKVRQEIYLGPDSIARQWLRAPYKINGWRLDAPNMLGCNGTDAGNLEVWQEFRRSVKAENPDAYLFGECFFEGTKWLQGNAFDAVMNYKGFTLPLIQWASGADLHLNPAEISARDMAQWMKAMMARIPFDIRNLQYNQLSTHDIPRFIHRVSGSQSLYKMAFLIQMAFPGVPSIYYGEEAALDGARDPDNRRPMPWDTLAEHQDLQDLIRKAANLKRTLPVLEAGAFVFLHAEDDTLAFARFVGDDFVLVAANRHGSPRKLRIPVAVLGLPEGQPLRSLLSMDSLKVVKESHIALTLPPRSAVWLGPA